jgi:hypothetical protein
MIQIILTEQQQRLLDESSEPVQIMDRSGVVLTTVGHGFTEAELDRIAEEARHFQPAAASLRELLDRFQSQASRLAQ